MNHTLAFPPNQQHSYYPPTPQAATAVPVNLPPRTLPGRTVRSRNVGWPQRARLWWRHRPNLVATLLLTALFAYCAGVYRAYQAGPWTGAKSVVTAVGLIVLLNVGLLAAGWIRAWHRNNP